MKVGDGESGGAQHVNRVDTIATREYPKSSEAPVWPGQGGFAVSAPFDNSKMFDKRKWWCAWLAVAMLGCSPALNWRDARLEAGALSMLLPCKPDKVTRDVDMGGQTRSMSMVGCQADGATFAVSHVLVADTGEAQAVLAGWKVAVLAHAHAEQAHAQPFTLPGAWQTPQTTRVQAQGRRVEGGEVALDASWFARVGPAGVHLFHAVVLAASPVPMAAQTFFTSLALQ